jgi:hypothetical protein
VSVSAKADRKQAAFRGLVERVLGGQGQASVEARGGAFAGSGGIGVPEAVRGLVGKVAATPALVTDADFAAGRAAGLSEDQLFEVVVCAAVGQATRQYEAGLAALDEALGSLGEGQVG